MVAALEDSLVPLLDGSIAGGSSGARIVRIEDPGDAALLRPYLLLSKNIANERRVEGADAPFRTAATAAICELQRLPASSTAGANKAGVPDEYASLLVAGHVVGKGVDNGLYVVTPVDPLFWVLSASSAAITSASDQRTTEEKEERSEQCRSQQQQQQWQPLEQIIAGYSDGSDSDRTYRYWIDALDRDQLPHLLERIDIGDREYCFRFSEARALRWLSRKRRSVESVLLAHERRAAEHEDKVAAAEAALEQKSQQGSACGGAFSSSFQLPEELVSHQTENERPNTTGKGEDNGRDDATTKNAAASAKAIARAREESVQIVCNYLNSYWRERFLRNLELTDEVLLDAEAKRKRKRENEAPADVGATGTDAGRSIKKKLSNQLPAVTQDWNETLQQQVLEGDALKGSQSGVDKKFMEANKPSVASRRLEKVNKKGMKKMTSFFAAKKK